MAAALLDIERDADRAARELLGSGLAEIRHFGSYACRRMTGNRRRTSLHASARAIDIAGFRLENGTRVSVLEDWGSGPKGEFLRRVATSACRRFGVVLTPAHDRDHRDHIHIDIGPWKLCGV